MMTLRHASLTAAFLHLILALAFLALSIIQDNYFTVPRLRSQVTKQFGMWAPAGAMDNASHIIAATYIHTDICPLAGSIVARDHDFIIQQVVLDVGETDVRIMIAIFHALSALFQFFNTWDEKNYYSVLDAGHTHISHYVEYSISASIMLIALCTQLGVTDVFLILNIASNCWACMVFGVFAEQMFDASVPDVVVEIYIFRRTFSPHWMAHLAGWVTLTAAMAGAVSNLFTNKYCANSENLGRGMPDYVWGIVMTEVVLFTVFGFVQWYAFSMKEWIKKSTPLDKQENERKKIAYTVEKAFVTLSFVAKTVLGLGIYLGNLFNK